MTKRVTVLLSTYNHAPYIRQALDSVLMQQTSFDFDVVVLDDASNDGTTKIVRSYVATSSGRLRVVVNSHNVCDNRAFAHALASSKAEYFAVLDGDDYWTHPARLQRLVDLLDAEPGLAIAFHNAEIRYEGSEFGRARNGVWDKQVSSLEDICAVNFISGCAALIRRETVDPLPGWFEHETLSDWALYLLAAQHGDIGYVDESMGCYRLHENGFWSSRSLLDKLQLIADFYSRMCAHFDERLRGVLLQHRDGTTKALRAHTQRTLAATRHAEVDSSGVTLGERILQTIRSELAPDMFVAIATGGDGALLACAPRPALNFPPPSALWESAVPLSAACSGEVLLPWLAEGVAYCARLVDERTGQPTSAAVTIARGTDYGIPFDATEHGPITLRALPNPVPIGREWDESTISWSAANLGGCRLELSEYEVCPWLPSSEAELLAAVGLLRGAGVGAIILPGAANEWLDRNPGFARILAENGGLLFSDTECRVYGLST